MIKRVGYLLSSLIAFAALLLPASQVLAASATLYLSPSSGSVANGDTISVGIRENSGSQAVNGVQANLTYPASLFDVANVISSSAFSITAQNNYGNGSIQLGRGALPSVSGDQLVATIVFKAKASSGTAGVSFAAGSQVAADDGNGTNILSGTSGGNYSLAAPTQSGGSTGSTGSTSGSTGSTSSKSKSSGTGSNTSSAKDTAPPIISGVKVQGATTTTATIAWTTSEPATSEVDYGVNNGYGLTAVNGSLVTDHAVTLNSPIISAATTYHFTVKSSDAAGNQATGVDGTFRTLGGVLNVTVLSKSKKPVVGATVSFAGQSAKTDKKGKASVGSLPAGTLAGYVEYKGTKTTETIDIKTADPSKPQSITFKIKVPTNSLIYILPIAVILALAAYLIFRRRTPAIPEYIPPEPPQPPLTPEPWQTPAPIYPPAPENPVPPVPEPPLTHELPPQPPPPPTNPSNQL